MTKQHLQEQLEYLRARYDSGAVSPAIYQAIKKLETDVAWCEHTARERENAWHQGQALDLDDTLRRYPLPRCTAC
jgi:hypothetical protein